MNDFQSTDYHTQFSPLEGEYTISQEIEEKLKTLPRGRGVLRFIDYDGTLFDDTRRFVVDPNLKIKENRGDGAYMYIPPVYSTRMHLDPTEANPQKAVTYDENEAYDNFVNLLKPSEHIFENSSEFFDPNNPFHYILTAGHKYYQGKKIDASGFGPSVQKIIVPKARDKIPAMLEQIIKLGYIPESIEFYDDRINETLFDGAAENMSRLLSGISVKFFHMEKDKQEEKRVSMKLHQVSSRVGEILEMK